MARIPQAEPDTGPGFDPLLIRVAGAVLERFLGIFELIKRLDFFFAPAGALAVFALGFAFLNTR